MESVRRKSLQRERIFELIQSSGEHPTVQSIYDTLKKEIKSLSLGNVYRNVRILAEQGRIRCRDFGDGTEHCDAITGAHYHFICEKCGSVSDFSMPVRASINREAQRLSKNKIKGHTINFHGICERCTGRAKT